MTDAGTVTMSTKELRLQGISTSEAANAYLPEFRIDYNERFAREPQSPHDAHRPVREDEDVERIFTWQEERKLSKNPDSRLASTRRCTSSELSREVTDVRRPGD